MPSKRENHFFLETPDGYSIPGALRRAQVFAQGGDERVARGLVGTRLERAFDNHEFWETVISFFIRHPDLPPNRYGPVIDYIQDQRFGRPRVVFADGMLEAVAPEQPNLTMRGRSPEALLRQVGRWQRRAAREGRASKAEWKPSGFPGYEASEGTGHWRIRELSSGRALAEEGRTLEHCAATCVDRCRQGLSSLWSLEVDEGEGFEKRITIEVATKSLELVQARGRCNRDPDEEEIRHIVRWAEMLGLVLRLPFDT